MKQEKTVKAWAVVSEKGGLYEHSQHATLSIFADKDVAENYHWTPERVVEVTITYKVED